MTKEAKESSQPTRSNSQVATAERKESEILLPVAEKDRVLTTSVAQDATTEYEACHELTSTVEQEKAEVALVPCHSTASNSPEVAAVYEEFDDHAPTVSAEESGQRCSRSISANKVVHFLDSPA